jgi:hypothetical protein
MQEEHVLDVCRIGTHHKNDFDEVMFVVQISIRNYEIMDVLLDGGFGVNIIYERLQRKLGLEETSISAIYGKNGGSKQGTTSRVDMKPQNRFSKVYIQNLSYSVTNGRYSRSLFDVFRKTMA